MSCPGFLLISHTANSVIHQFASWGRIHGQLIYWVGLCCHNYTVMIHPCCRKKWQWYIIPCTNKMLSHMRTGSVLVVGKWWMFLLLWDITWICQEFLIALQVVLYRQNTSLYTSEYYLNVLNISIKLNMWYQDNVIKRQHFFGQYNKHMNKEKVHVKHTSWFSSWSDLNISNQFDNQWKKHNNIHKIHNKHLHPQTLIYIMSSAIILNEIMQYFKTDNVEKKAILLHL